MINGFKVILIKNYSTFSPRATLSNGVLTINKQLIKRVCKKGNIEIGINTKDKKICICESGKTDASMPIKEQQCKNFSSKEFIKLITKLIPDFDESKRYDIPVIADEGFVILSLEEAKGENK